MQTLLKRCSIFFVYMAAALLAFSVTGWYLYANDFLNSYPAAILLRKISLVLLFIKIIGTRYSLKQFLFFLAGSALAIYNYTLCGNTTFIYSIFFVTALKDVDLSTLFKILFGSTTCSLLLWGTFSYLGIGDVISITQDFGRDSIETRYCWGMHHPNIWHFAFARCIVYFVLGFKNKLKWSVFIALLLLNYFAYRLTISRTGFLATTIFLLMILAYRYLPKLMQTLAVKTAILSGIIGIYGLFLYFFYEYITTRSDLSMLICKKLTTGRLTKAASYLSRHPVQWFGSEFYYETIFDCGFLRLFYDNGYILAGIFFLAFFILLILALKHNWDVVITICIFTVLYSIYEIDPITRPTYNFSVFFMSLLLYKDQLKYLHKTSSTP